tara:strand:- start:355 stop:1425 length:1071 start_codon:yes stop_codon:yes gene_type:complete
MPINSFSQFLVEEEKTVYFTFGRMNPPTIGHGKLLDKLASTSGRNPYRVFLSLSNDKKNPIPYNSKIKYVRKMFPKHARQVMMNKKVVTPFAALTALYNEGFRSCVMVAGSDRVNEYNKRLNMYNGKKGRHGFYNFKDGIKIVSAGQRDPDAEGAEGASGTKQRKYAVDNDFTKFAQGLPSAMSNNDAKKLFNDVRRGLGLKETKEFKNMIQFDSVSPEREAYVEGQLFSEGDEVIIKETNEVGTITVCGTNYVIVEANGHKTRQWLDAVEKVLDYGTDASVKDIKKKFAPKEANNPAYHKGLAKSTKDKRKAQFKRQAKMPDGDPKSYKPAPGDADAKTKPSKHTKKFKQMFGDD